MKRAWSVILVIVLLVSAMPMRLMVNAVGENELIFTLNSDGESYSVKTYDPTISGELVIPSTYDGKPVTAIGDFGFHSCNFLTRVIIGDNVTTIGYYAFGNCESLKSVTVPNGVGTIKDYAFYGCNALNSIIIPSSVVAIGDYAFYYCKDLTNVVIPKSVTTIGDSSFAACDSLTNVTISDGVEIIGNHAFFGCDALTNITIPSSVITIGDKAFFGCKDLENITVNENNGYYASVDGVLFNKDKTTLIQYPIASVRTSYTIPNGVTTIGDSAFSPCQALTNVTIPNGVTTIGNSAFSSCQALTNVTIPNSVTTIGDSAFLSCQALKSVIIPNGVAVIEDYAFYYCTDLESVTISDGVTAIGEAAFWVCKSLTTVIIPDGVTTIGNLAFGDCSALENVTIPDSVTTIGDFAFSHCEALTDIYYRGSMQQKERIKIKTESDTLPSVWHYYSCIGSATHQSIKGSADCSVCGAACNPFADVKKKDYYYKAVLWAVENGVTSGTSPTTFAPKEACTRGQIVAFLWRAAGSPAPKSSRNPFTDVKKSDYYYKAVLWAVENGITAGSTPTTFAPKEACTRGQIVAFLWRAAGNPKPQSSRNPFTDVKKSDYYYKAVLWAVENGITAGSTPTTFAPKAPCTRGQIAAFLYRYYN